MTKRLCRLHFQTDVDKLFDQFARSIHPPIMLGMKQALTVDEFTASSEKGQFKKKRKKKGLVRLSACLRKSFNKLI